MPTFLELLRPHLDTHLGVAAYTVVDEKVYPGGAHVDILCDGIVMQVCQEYMADFFIHVSPASEPSREYPFPEILFVASGEPVSRAKVVAKHDLAGLGDYLRQFAAGRAALRELLRPERREETDRRLQEIREQTMLPEIRAALLEARKRG